MGLEPTNGGTTILCLNHLATLAIAFHIIALLWEINPHFFKERTQLIWSLETTANHCSDNESLKYYGICGSFRSSCFGSSYD